LSPLLLLLLWVHPHSAALLLPLLLLTLVRCLLQLLSRPASHVQKAGQTLLAPLAP
jgi:hypothetical protein